MKIAELTLQFEHQPFTCTILREGQSLLQILTPYPVVEKWQGDRSCTFRFPDHQLSIQINPDSFLFRWEGSGVRIQIPIEGHWYGGGALINQPLRWNEIMLPLTEFATDDNGPTGLTTALTPAWLNSRGIGLWVQSPFQLGVNQPPQKYRNRQRGISPDLIPFDQRPFLDHKGEGDGHFTLVGDGLEFEILTAGDVLGIYRSLVDRFGTPPETPPLELLGAPIWTTWARYKDRIDQETVLAFAREIRDQGYPYHILEIDDRWQTQYGDLEFDPERFPDPAGMIKELKEMGFRITAWVIPFFHPFSLAGQEAAASGYIVKTNTGEPYRVKWWQGAGYLLDVTNPAALDWYRDRLEKFQARIGLDGYKFDAGEAKFAPADGIFQTPLSSPNEYTHRYVKWISENFHFCEVRSAWMNQTSPIFFRIWDLWSTWGVDNGLRAIIPTTLSMSLTGYPFVFPDMIGGNAYFRFPANKLVSGFFHRIVIPILERRLKSASQHPEEESLGLSDVPPFLERSVHFGYPTPELIIRWTQLNLFLGVMQFSLAPWDFGEETNRICRQYAQLHLEFVPVLEEYARQAVKTGEPIFRPVFWLAPEDEDALTCQDQFLVGDEILVAPVVHPRQRSRKIYFPPGSWQDYWSGEIHTGPKTIPNYPAPLDRLPFFIRQEPHNISLSTNQEGKP